jgi:hypothetical protein
VPETPLPFQKKWRMTTKVRWHSRLALHSPMSMRCTVRRYMPLILLLVVAANSDSVLAQEDACLHRTLAVNVLDDNDALIAGLAAGDFKASLGKQPITIVSAKPNAVPPRVVIVLDASRSMIENKLDWDYDLRAARTMLRDLPKDASVGLALFSAKIELNIPPTQDRQKLVAELNRLATGERAFPKGSRRTALWDALNAVASDFDPPRVGDSIYVITDAGDNVSVIHAGALKKTLLEKGIRLFALSLQMEFSGPPTDSSPGGRDLKDLINSTGGAGVSVNDDPLVPTSGTAHDPIQLGILLAAQIRQVFAYYEVEVELLTQFDKPRDWKLEAALANKRHARVIYPGVLLPCAEPKSAAVPPN